MNFVLNNWIITGHVVNVCSVHKSTLSSIGIDCLKSTVEVEFCNGASTMHLTSLILQFQFSFFFYYLITVHVMQTTEICSVDCRFGFQMHAPDFQTSVTLIKS